MTTWSTVDCSEVHGTRKETKDVNGGPGGYVELDCLYADRHDLADDLMTNSRWPFTPVGRSAPAVLNIGITPWKDKADTIEQSLDYQNARLAVKYGFDNSSGSEQGGGGGTGRQRYVESFEPELEVISLKDRTYYYKKGGKNVPLPASNIPHYREYRFSINRTFYNWIALPLTFKTFVGYVNNAQVTFPTLGLSFAAEELLFVPINAQRTISSEGTDGFTVQVKFVFQEGGWNKFPVPAGNRVDVFYVDDDKVEQSLKPHPLGDFSGWIF